MVYIKSEFYLNYQYIMSFRTSDNLQRYEYVHFHLDNVIEQPANNQSQKKTGYRFTINDRREQCRVCLTIREAGGIFCETMGGGVLQETETLTLSAAQTHTAYTIGVRPPGFEVFCICKCGSTSNACFVYVRSGRILFAL